jgi:hypothetical protein
LKNIKRADRRGAEVHASISFMDFSLILTCLNIINNNFLTIWQCPHPPGKKKKKRKEMPCYGFYYIVKYITLVWLRGKSCFILTLNILKLDLSFTTSIEPDHHPRPCIVTGLFCPSRFEFSLGTYNSFMWGSFTASLRNILWWFYSDARFCLKYCIILHGGGAEVFLHQ